MRFSWRYALLIGILIQSDILLPMQNVFREDIDWVIPVHDNKVVTQKEQAYFRALTTVFADAYKHERGIFREERRLQKSMQRRNKEILDEMDDLLGETVIRLGAFAELSAASRERLFQLSQERDHRRAYVEQKLMSRLLPKQQVAVQEYVRERDEFLMRKKDADRMGGTPFYELDLTVFVPFPHPRERSNVCSYLMENRLRGVAPSCKLERAAAAHCPEALALLGYEEMAARYGHKQLCLKQANFCFEKLMDEYLKDKIDFRNYFAAFYWYQKILQQPIRYINTDGDLKIPKNAGVLLPITKSERICYAQAACNLGILCTLKVGVPKEFANNIQARRYFRFAVSFDYEPAVWALIYFEFAQKHVPPCNLGRCNALFSQALTLVNRYARDRTCENELFLQRACCVLSECSRQFSAFMPFTMTYFDKVAKLVSIVEAEIGVPEESVKKQFVRLVKQLLSDGRKKVFKSKPQLAPTEVKESAEVKAKELAPVELSEKSEANCSRSEEASCSRPVEVVSTGPEGVSSPSDTKAEKPLFSEPQDKAECHLDQPGEFLFEVNFQPRKHTPRTYLKNDKRTLDSISACYLLASKLANSDPLKATRMFIAAESAVVFLYKKYRNKDIAYLPEGVAALNVLQKTIRQREDINLLAALIFSVSCRYSDGILHAVSLDSLASLSKLFLVLANRYFKEGDHSNKQQVLLMCLACNAYCILGCKLKIQECILIDLMRGVVSVAPEEYWFFRYNLESITAGCQDESVGTLKPYSKNLSSIKNDGLLKAMIICGYKRPTFFSWCGIL
jgi:hypothetical protein